MNVYIVEYQQGREIVKQEFTKFTDAIRFIKSMLDRGVVIFRLDMVKNNKTEPAVYFVGDKTGISEEGYLMLKEKGVCITEKKTIEKRNNYYEITYRKDRILRFSSQLDMFCYLSPVGIPYNYHQFNYSPEVSSSLNRDAYLDDDMVLIHSKEDIAMLQTIEQRYTESEEREPAKTEDKESAELNMMM